MITIEEMLFVILENKIRGKILCSCLCCVVLGCMLSSACGSRDYQYMAPFGLTVPVNGLRIVNEYTDSIEITWDSAKSTVCAAEDLEYAIYLWRGNVPGTIKDVVTHASLIDSRTGLAGRRFYG